MKTLCMFLFMAKVQKKSNNVSEKEAARLMKITDKKRSINYNFYTDRQWGKAQNYDLCLNSSALGYEVCADIIAEIAK